MRPVRRHIRRSCIVATCERPIEPWMYLCAGCWSRLPHARRSEIRTARDAKAQHEVSRLSLAAAEWLNQHDPTSEAARRMGERE